MTRFLALLALIAVFAYPGNGYAQTVTAAPDVVRMPPEEGFSGPPIWVSAKAAADPDHVVKWELFGDSSDQSSLHTLVRDRVNALAGRGDKGAEVAEVPEKECPDFTVSSAFSHLASTDRAAESLHDLVGNAMGIYTGVVTARTPGFSFEVPSTVLTVKVTKTLRAASSFTDISILHVLSPIAHFRIGAYVLCGEQIGTLGEAAVGDQVLVFVYQWAKPGTALVAPQENQLIIADRHGVRIPPALRSDTTLPVKTFDAMVSAVTQAIQLST